MSEQEQLDVVEANRKIARQSKLFTNLSIVTMALSAAMAISLFCFIAWPVKVIEFNAPFIVQNKTLKSGDFVIVSSDFCKYRDGRGDVSITFVGANVTFPNIPYYIDRQTGCHKTTEILAVVPPFLPPGEYSIRAIYTYQINPIRYYTKTMTTDKFTVIK